jgi:5'-methylthioadenosine phosphorylase
MKGVEVVETIDVDTPFGRPSSPVVVGAFDGIEVAFIARHGGDHRIPPHEVPSRANLYALKTLGVRRVLAVNAVGSLREELKPGDLVVPDYLFDRTWGREQTYFEGGLVAHVDAAEPFCSDLRAGLLTGAAQVDALVHFGGTLVVVQGPRFSTKAESAEHRRAGFSIVGMTTQPEATLAREAEMCYAAICVVTDYDVWHATEEAVTVEAVIRTLRSGIGHARALIQATLSSLVREHPCACERSLDSAIVTQQAALDPETIARLQPIVGRALGGPTPA